jgi:hypothetical protein
MGFQPPGQAGGRVVNADIPIKSCEFAVHGSCVVLARVQYRGATAYLVWVGKMGKITVVTWGKDTTRWFVKTTNRRPYHQCLLMTITTTTTTIQYIGALSRSCCHDDTAPSSGDDDVVVCPPKHLTMFRRGLRRPMSVMAKPRNEDDHDEMISTSWISAAAGTSATTSL